MVNTIARPCDMGRPDERHYFLRVRYLTFAASFSDRTGKVGDILIFLILICNIIYSFSVLLLSIPDRKKSIIGPLYPYILSQYCTFLLAITRSESFLARFQLVKLCMLIPHFCLCVRMPTCNNSITTEWIFMAFNTVGGGLLRFVRPFQLRLNSDNSERPFLHRELFVLCVWRNAPATR
jgi:hypothetical protein